MEFGITKRTGADTGVRFSLFDAIVDALTAPTMQLQRLSSRHPEMIPILLRSMLRQTVEYAMKSNPPNEMRVVLSNDDNNEEDDEDDDYDYYLDDLEEVRDKGGDDKEDIDSLDDHEYDNNGNTVDTNRNEDIAQEITNAFVKEWTDVVNGVNQMDAIFGYNGHDLLLLDDDDNDNDNDDDDVDDSSSSVGGGSSSSGVGLSVGIWSHSLPDGK